MFESSQSWVSWPLETDWVKMATVPMLLQFPSGSGSVFRLSQGICGIDLLEQLSPPRLVICSPESVGQGLPCSVGMLVASSGVRTDCNCLLSISALLLLSQYRSVIPRLQIEIWVTNSSRIIRIAKSIRTLGRLYVPLDITASYKNKDHLSNTIWCFTCRADQCASNVRLINVHHLTGWTMCFTWQADQYALLDWLINMLHMAGWSMCFTWQADQGW